ncbi:MAG: hypothetical protein ACFCA4_06140 [Cyanophyceae cyanobacterium]
MGWWWGDRGCQDPHKETTCKTMPLTELLPALQKLPRPDKLRVMQFLLLEIAREENLTLVPDATYDIWSPFDSHQAAHQLTALLDTEDQ